MDDGSLYYIGQKASSGGAMVNWVSHYKLVFINVGSNPRKKVNSKSLLWQYPICIIS
jgi:hypothetical protein